MMEPILELGNLRLTEVPQHGQGHIAGSWTLPCPPHRGPHALELFHSD